LPIDFSADEATFRKQFEAMTTICELAGSLNCSTCYAIVESSADELAFQENFDRHQKRLVEAGEQLEKAGIKLGLRLSPKSNRVKRSYNFVQTVSELLTLVRMIGHKNVGICFDALAWVNSEGTIEDMQKLKAEQITEVRLADLQDNIAVLPGNGNDSFSLAVAHHLKAIQYDGLISVVGNPSIFGSGSRDRVLPQLVKRLDEFVELIKGERTELSCNQAAEADDTAVETDNELVKT
jgi:hydroxypyruvate isomerase